MIDILSKFTLEILFEITDYLKYFSHDIDDFTSSQFKNSEVKEVLKEEFLRVSLFNKLQNYLNNKVVRSGVDLIKWNKFIVEKEYPKNPKLKCDIFFEGQIARHNVSSAKVFYKKNAFRDVWIELKFFIPTYHNSASNVGNITNDLLRLYYLAENTKKNTDIERYFIVFILCGKYQKNKVMKNMAIKNYFGSDSTMSELFFPIDLNVNSKYLFHFVDFLKDNVEKKNFMKKIKSFVPMLKKKIDLDIIYITRRILTPIEFFSPKMNSSNFDKNLFGYIFKIDGFRKLKAEEIINLDNL